jgi:hypothetical protein
MINSGFNDQGKFYIEYKALDSNVGNLREECEKLARKLGNTNKKIMLGLSSGLDSQVVLHSFVTQNIPIQTAFLYMRGFNDIEYYQILILEKKYSIQVEKIELDPIAIQDEVMAEWLETGIYPNQLIHKKFLSMLPTDVLFLQGFNGIYLTVNKNVPYLFDSYDGYEISRFRGFSMLNREGGEFNWNSNSEITCSVLNEEIVQSFLRYFNYYSNNGIVYKNKTAPPPTNYWDLYLKPLVFSKYWKDELEIFPKYGGFEKITYVVNGQAANWKNKFVLANTQELLHHFHAGTGFKRFIQLEN